MNGEKDLIENKPNTDSLLRMAEIIGNKIENISVIILNKKHLE